MAIFEACVGNYNEAVKAELRGANRIELGIDRILTKGGPEDAVSGKDSLKSLVQYADGRMSIMPGKGVNMENRDFLLEYTGASEIHGSKVV